MRFPSPPPQGKLRYAPASPASQGEVSVPATTEPPKLLSLPGRLPSAFSSSPKRSQPLEPPDRLSKRPRTQDQAPEPLLPLTPSDGHAPELPSKRRADTPITSPSPFPGHPYQEFLLDKDVSLEDFPLLVEPCLWALRELGYPQPKSADQLKAMMLVLNHRHNLLLVLPTGFGKTSLFQFLAKLPVGFAIEGEVVAGNTIIVTPFTPLLLEHVKSSRAKGIEVFNWQTDRRVPGFRRVPSTTRLLLIQPESFISRTFMESVFPLSFHFYGSSR